ncbi:MAG: hypothetical protein DCC75_01560 [Proteobacteria bacterium]|nr:MAG: hypothetical protein DCC75_01560 [Pseudomonadota bacterium]
MLQEDPSHLVLLVDDDGEVLLTLSRALKGHGLTARVEGLSSCADAIEYVKQSAPNVAVLDLSIDPKRGVESGFDLLQAIVRSCSSCRVIVLTGHHAPMHGVRALQLGAAHFLAKPPDIQHLLALIKDGLAQSELRRAYERLKSKEAVSLSEMIAGDGKVIHDLRATLLQAGQTNQTVLLTGETGTGKGLCALALHKFGIRAAGKFVRYQPSFSSPDLVNSELFGHVKGAFTGASDARSGLIEEADGGTLFLDEIDQLPAETQVALLGVLQERKFRRLGTNTEMESNFRLICASNADIESALEQGKIRRDFYHRVAHLLVHLPSLRERREDIPLLAERVLRLVAEREQLNVFKISPEANEFLCELDWPGNVRELEAVVEGAIYKAAFRGSGVVETGDLGRHAGARSPGHETFQDKVRDYRLSLINQALSKHDGNQVRAAGELGLDRSSMRRLLAKSTSQAPHNRL